MKRDLGGNIPFWHMDLRFLPLLKKMNISFDYLYRDAGNYKLYGTTIFSNGTKISLSEIKAKVKDQLMEMEYFIPEKWNIKRLSFESFIPELDHEWHEFFDLNETSQPATDCRDISVFIEDITN